MKGFNKIFEFINKIKKKFKKNSDKNDDFYRNVKNAQKRVKMKEVTPEELDRFINKLIDRIEKGGYNPSHVLNDMNALSAFIREVVLDDASLLDVADAYIVKAVNRMSNGISRDEELIKKLVEEFTENPNRIVTSQGLPYDTSVIGNLTASKYVEALYRAFKNKAFSKGLSDYQFRRALDDILTNEPYELYEGKLNNRGNITRSRILKPASEIVDLAIARGLGYDDYKVVERY